MTFPKVMIVSAALPSNRDVSELWLSAICNAIPAEKICLFYLTSAEFAQEQLPDTPFEIRRHIYTPLPSFQTNPIKRLLYPLLSAGEVDRLVKAAADFGREQRIDIVMVFLHENLLVRMAAPLYKALAVPMVGFVWDPPEYINRRSRLDILGIEHRRHLDRFYETLELSNACGVMSVNMQDRYSKHCTCITVNYPVPTSIISKKTDLERSSSEVVIGFAGSLYAREEFQAMLNTLDSLEWRVSGKPVKLQVVGKQINIMTEKPANIIFSGWRTPEQTIELLEQSHVLYLPYRFADEFASAAKLAFPTKLSTFLAARVPVLYHGPPHSSISAFYDRYQIGTKCESMDRTHFMSALTSLVENHIDRRRSIEAIDCALEEVFSLEVFSSKLKDLLTINRNYT